MKSRHIPAKYNGLSVDEYPDLQKAVEVFNKTVENQARIEADLLDEEKALEEISEDWEKAKVQHLCGNMDAAELKPIESAKLEAEARLQRTKTDLAEIKKIRRRMKTVVTELRHEAQQAVKENYRAAFRPEVEKFARLLVEAAKCYERLEKLHYRGVLELPAHEIDGGPGFGYSPYEWHEALATTTDQNGSLWQRMIRELKEAGYDVPEGYGG